MVFACVCVVLFIHITYKRHAMCCVKSSTRSDDECFVVDLVDDKMRNPAGATVPLRCVEFSGVCQ